MDVFEPACAPTPTMPCFQRHPMSTPASALGGTGPLASETLRGPLAWMAIHPDPFTDTLVVLCNGGLLFLHGYQAHFLQGASLRVTFMEFPRTVYQVCATEDASGWQHRRLLPPHWGLFLAHQKPGFLAVHQGRVVVVHGMVLMVDLCAPSAVVPRSSRDVQGPTHAPYSTYIWTDIMDMMMEDETSMWPMELCSCVQMDDVRTWMLTYRRVSTMYPHKFSRKRSAQTRCRSHRRTRKPAWKTGQLWSPPFDGIPPPSHRSGTSLRDGGES